MYILGEKTINYTHVHDCAIKRKTQKHSVSTNVESIIFCKLGGKKPIIINYVPLQLLYVIVYTQHTCTYDYLPSLACNQ